MPDNTSTPLRVLRLPAVLERTALSRTRLFELVKAGQFPAPAKLANSRVNIWASSDVDGWIRHQFERTDP